MFGRLFGLSKSAARKRAQELLEQFGLVHAGKRRVSTYSGGMRRRIDIACGLVVQPQVAFLDEPTTGLDPRSRQAIWDLVASFKKLGIATLLTTQYLEEADALSDRIILIDHGKIIADGTANELKHRAGDTFCEIVPRDLKDLAAVVAALGSLLPEQSRAIVTARIRPDHDAGAGRDAHAHRGRAAARRGKYRAGRHCFAPAVTRRRIPFHDSGSQRVPRSEPSGRGGHAMSAPAFDRTRYRAWRRHARLWRSHARRRATQWWVLIVRFIAPSLRDSEKLITGRGARWFSRWAFTYRSPYRGTILWVVAAQASPAA